MREVIKTPQYAHQRETFERCRDLPYFALFWEMGLGKSKMVLDVASYQFAEGRVDQLLVLAPGVVTLTWTEDEVPAHLAARHLVLRYPGDDGRAQGLKILWLDPLRGRDSLRVLVMSYDSLGTPHGLRFAVRACTIFRTMIVADESTKIKTHSTRQTKRAKKVAELCEPRYILTGTPAAQSPFDLHSQIQFLDPEFWGRHGVRTLGAFKTEFGVARVAYGQGGRQFVRYVGYRRLERLREIVAEVSSRLLKEDSDVRLPPKVYRTCTYELESDQRTTYDAVRRECEVEIAGGVIDARSALTRLLRLQQISSGFVTTEDDDGETSVTVVVPPERNPRLRLLRELLDGCDHRVVVWCRFVVEVETICAEVPDAVRHDGTMSEERQRESVRRFRDDDDTGARVLVATLRSMAHGVTLTCARTMVYYSNDYSLELRLQSEDRAHRIGQKSSVMVVDLVGRGTIDRHVVRTLRSKYDVAAEVTGDVLREWVKI